VSASARVMAPEIPLHSLGASTGPVIYRPRRPSRTTYAPHTPLYQLGYAGLGELGDSAQILAASAPIAAVGTTAAITAAAGGSAAAAGTTAGAVAGPIGAAVGAIVGIIAGLMAGHELRAKQAKNENAAVNLGVPGFDQGLRQIQQAYLAGKISAADVQQGVSVLLSNFWQEVAPNIQPGRNGCNSGSSCPPDTSAAGKQPCAGNIGAACCVGCFPLTESITGPSGVLAALAGQSTSKNGPTKAEIMAVGASKYGTSYRAPYTLDFTPPPAPAASGAITSAIDAITGLPVSAALGVGSGSSLMPLLLIGGLLYLVSR
jgi:hypothetical protein